MKRKFLIIFTLIILFECIFIINKSFATVDQAGYTITNYDVDMVVNEDNSIDVTEIIDVFFSEERHGIFRTIPLKNTVEREDGTITKNKVKIENIKVNESYTDSIISNILEIKIGDANKTVSGYQTYEISYTYRIGKDPLKDVDELYYNIIGTLWTTNIEHVDFRITMPEDFDESKLGFTSGTKGSVRNLKC